MSSYVSEEKKNSLHTKILLHCMQGERQEPEGQKNLSIPVTETKNLIKAYPAGFRYILLSLW